MMQVERGTFVQEQTGKVHLVNVAMEEVDFYQCFCSLRRRYEPEVEEVELTDENVCRTCAKGYCRENGIEIPDELESEDETATA